MNRRKRLMVLAFSAAILIFLMPRLPFPQRIYRYLWVIDITQSMNTQDYNVKGLPTDRLGFVKTSLRQALPELPCGSEVGIGIFTHQMTQILFEPLEVCDHIGVIDDVIAHLDWRMAWAANSQIDQGLAAALRRVRERNPDWHLVFFTDGQTAPGETRQPDFSAERGRIKGFIAGTGSRQPSLIPRYDRENRLLGYFQKSDLEEPLAPESKPQDTAGGTYYQSWLDEAHLLKLSDAAGLDYHRLETPEGLIKALNNPNLGEYRMIPLDMHKITALLTLILLLAAVITG